jgi:hypothetical protein
MNGPVQIMMDPRETAEHININSCLLVLWCQMKKHKMKGKNTSIAGK